MKNMKNINIIHFNITVKTLVYTYKILFHLQIFLKLHFPILSAASCGISGIPGFFMSSFLMEAYGRKIAHLLVILPGTVGWLAIYYAQGVPAILLGRILGGATAGATVSLGAIVIGEFSNPKYRGVFLNLKTVSVCLGGMIVHVLDHFISWRTIAFIAIIPHILAILIVLTWPETPAWLAANGKFDESKKSFYWLREKSEASQKEIDALINAQTERLSTPKVEASKKDVIIDFFKKFTRKDFIMPLIIVTVSTILLEASGRHIFPAYALQIIGEISGDKSQSFYYTLGIDVIVTASALSSSILVKIMKRRKLLFSTGFAAVAVLMVACTYLTLVAHNKISNDQPWIAMSIFVIFFILANLGCTPIPLALLGEVFPLPHRGVGSAIAGICISLGVMVALQITPYLLVHAKVHGMFFVYGVTMGFTLAILYFVLPETKDRTLQEIEDYFNYGKFKDNTDEVEEVKVKMVK